MQRFKCLRARPWWVAGALLSLMACTTTESIIPDRRPDYRESKVMSSLEVPPDLTASTIDDTLVVPELNPTGSASLSEYAGERRGGTQVAATAETVLQNQDNIRLERDGNRRWLVVQQDAGVLWPRIKEFWTSNGLLLEKEDPRIGIMETKWAENRADIPDGFVRNVLRRFLDAVYSAPTRDKFRVRLERVDGGTEVYLTHYGMEEAVRTRSGAGANAKEEGEVLWQPRPADPEIEAEMLNRLMVYLGASEKRAQTQLARAAAPTSPGPRAQMTNINGQQALSIGENYSRAWRLVGLALDGSNFVVENQNRTQGLYEVQYRDPNAPTGKQGGGWLSGLAFWRGNTPPPPGARFKVRLAGQGEQTVVVVQNSEGQPDDSATAQLILTSLQQVINGQGPGQQG